jgi:hypothetical protein
MVSPISPIAHSPWFWKTGLVVYVNREEVVNYRRLRLRFLKLLFFLALKACLEHVPLDLVCGEPRSFRWIP